MSQAGRKALTIRQERVLRERLRETAEEMESQIVQRAKEMVKPLSDETVETIHEAFETLERAHHAITLTREDLIASLVKNEGLDKGTTSWDWHLPREIIHAPLSHTQETFEQAIHNVVVRNRAEYGWRVHAEGPLEKLRQWRKGMNTRIDDAVLFGTGVEDMFTDMPDVSTFFTEEG